MSKRRTHQQLGALSNRCCHPPPPPPPLHPGPIHPSDKELQAQRLSCGEFAWLSEHARRHLKAVRETAGDPGIFEQELGLAEEMAQLQRRNIANLERKLQEQQRQKA